MVVVAEPTSREAESQAQPSRRRTRRGPVYWTTPPPSHTHTHPPRQPACLYHHHHTPSLVWDCSGTPPPSLAVKPPSCPPRSLRPRLHKHRLAGPALASVALALALARRRIACGQSSAHFSQWPSTHTPRRRRIATTPTCRP
jgi:hypothetical protein